MFGVGATEMAGVLATGEIWLSVPETIEIEWRGRFGPCVVAKDVMLFLCGQLGMEGGRTQAVHFRGEAIRALRDAGAHDALQHDGGARRPDRPVRSRRDDRGVHPRGRRRARRRRALAIGRRRGAGGAPPLRCGGAGAAGRGAAQPGQCRAGRRPRHGDDRRRPYRRLHRRQARRPAHGGVGAQGPQGRSRRVAAGRAGLAPRPGGRGERRHAADPDRRRREAAAERLRHVRRLQRHAGGERDLHLLDRAQLQGPHGHARAPTSISARPTRWRPPPCAGASPIRARCCHERATSAAPSSTATASTPTCWRPAST